MLTARIEALLNAGETVAAEVAWASPTSRTFLRIKPIPKPGVPREKVRYLNSTWSMWEYWDFELRRFELRQGWEEDEWNYDRFIVQDERIKAVDQATFIQALARWAPEAIRFQHIQESPCPE
jgi:hypothetical protein